MNDLTSDELQAIDFACIVLQEHARRGRQHQDACEVEGDSDGVTWYGESLQRVDAARVTLRALLAKHKDLMALAKWVRDKMEPLGQDPSEGIGGWRHMDATEVDSIVSGVLHFCDEAIAKAKGRTDAQD